MVPKADTSAEPQAFTFECCAPVCEGEAVFDFVRRAMKLFFCFPFRH